MSLLNQKKQHIIVSLILQVLLYFTSISLKLLFFWYDKPYNSKVPLYMLELMLLGLLEGQDSRVFFVSYG